MIDLTTNSFKILSKGIAQSLIDHNATISSAESCTGGRVSSTFTMIPGASEWFCGGIVAYTRDAKQEVLGIDSKILSDGLVTRQCAEAMALGVAHLFHSTYAVSTTGVCGPSWSEGYAPTTAWISIVNTAHNTIRSYFYQEEDQGRRRNIEFLTRFVLKRLIEEIEAS